MDITDAAGKVIDSNSPTQVTPIELSSLLEKGCLAAVRGHVGPLNTTENALQDKALYCTVTDMMNLLLSSEKTTTGQLQGPSACPRFVLTV